MIVTRNAPDLSEVIKRNVFDESASDQPRTDLTQNQTIPSLIKMIYDQ